MRYSLKLCALAVSIAAMLGAGTIRVSAQTAPENSSTAAKTGDAPWVFWYWMQAAVSKEGVTADLEAMKQAGIACAYLMPIKDVATPPLYDPPTRTLTPQWWEMLRHAASEAQRLGLKIAMHDCDGFATAGGPWITPELSMQKIVWSETAVGGGRKSKTALARPEALNNYYKDIAVLAFPEPTGREDTTRLIHPKITTNASRTDASGLAEGKGSFRSEQNCWIQYAFDAPFTCRSIVIRPGGNNYQGNRLIVESSDDGVNFRRVTRLESPRHGWQDDDADCTHAIPPTTARFFRLVYDKEGTEEGAEDLDSAKWKNRLKVSEIELSGAARIQHYEGKSGRVWRKSGETAASVVPDNLCIDPASIVDLSDKLDAEGNLNWDAPKGRWTVLRFGATTTGKTNYIGGNGIGLECDKFNPEAAKVQFDGWYGETLRQLGPELSKAISIFHVDSWEAGAQNWSPVLAAEFKKRRGYDMKNWLPTVAGFPIASADRSERFLYDLRNTIADLTIDGFFKPMAVLARDKDVTFTAEATAPTMPGDGMRHYAEADLPMGEFWLRSPTHDKPNDMQDAISAAHVYGKNIVAAESFTELRLQWDEHPGMLKALADHNFTLGINRNVIHVMMQNPWMDRKPGMTLGTVGLFFQRDQIWWPMARSFVRYLSECSAFLQEGRYVADVAYFTGEELPRRSIIPERQSPALPTGYKADSINRDALMRLAKVEDGRIVLPGGASYGLLVLPGEARMTPEFAGKLRELIAAGALVYGAPPSSSPSLENYPGADDAVRRYAAEIWGGANRDATVSRALGKGRVESNRPLADVLRDAKLAPDLLVQKDDAATTAALEKIEWTHRRVGEGKGASEHYFIANTADAPTSFQIEFPDAKSFAVLRNAAADTTTYAAARAAATPGRTVLKMSLPASGSAMVVVGAEVQMLSSAAPEMQPLLTVEGPWTVHFDPKLKGPENAVVFEKLTPWNENADARIRNYSGIARYETQFEWPADRAIVGNVALDLGDVRNLATVRVNGVDCGDVWTPPLRAKIPASVLRKGKNTIEIDVANTWLNRMAGDAALAVDDRITTATMPRGYGPKADTPLLPAGLLGPVTLLAETPSGTTN